MSDVMSVIKQSFGNACLAVCYLENHLNLISLLEKKSDLGCKHKFEGHSSKRESAIIFSLKKKKTCI